MRSEILALLAATGFLSAIAAVPSVSAQAQSGSKNIAPVCMALGKGNRGPLAIILPAGNQKAMVEKGFELRSCSESFGSRSQREAYRDRVCKEASRLTSEGQKQSERTRGESAAVLCGMAELVVGQWTRGGRS